MAGPAIKLHSRSHTHGVVGDGTALAPASLDVTAGPVRFSGDISPSQITADQNDYNPTGLATAAVLRLSSDASRTLTGLQGGADGRVLLIVNVGSQNIVLADESASSSAANRFALDAALTIAPDTGAILQYDSTSSRWRLVAKGAAAAAGEGGTYTGNKVITGSLTVETGPIALGASADVALARDAANILAQRNGTNNQTLRVYGTHTDASNYRRAALLVDTVNNTAFLSMQNAGTGAALGLVVEIGNSKTFNLRMLGQGWQMDANRNWVADQASDVWMPGATTNMTAGFLYVPAGAGAPTGTPTNAAAARTPLYYDSTNHKIYAYHGGTWRSTAALT